MKVNSLKVGEVIWCPWKHCYLWYNGRAYNAKDYEFVDAGDCIVILHSQEIEKLQEVKND